MKRTSTVLIELSPKIVIQRLRKLYKQKEELLAQIKVTQARCSHHKFVSFSSDIYESGWDCSACGAGWRRLPEGIEL